MKLRIALGIAAAFFLVGCAMTSGVMEGQDGTYLISAHAAPIRGGAAGASKVAYADAEQFCAAKGQRPIVLVAQDRDVYQGAVSSVWNGYGGSTSGGVFAAGHADLHFKCE